MVKVTRNRLARLRRAMPLEPNQGGRHGQGNRLFSSMRPSRSLSPVHSGWNKQGYLDKILPEVQTRALVLLVHGFAALIYYRFFFALLGGRSFGRIVAGTRLVDGAGGI
jgi:hypothetical protein